MTSKDVTEMVAKMGRLQGAVKSEAETFMALNSKGIKCVSIRLTTADDLINSMELWQAQLATLFHDEPTLEEEL